MRANRDRVPGEESIPGGEQSGFPGEGVDFDGRTGGDSGALVTGCSQPGISPEGDMLPGLLEHRPALRIGCHHFRGGLDAGHVPGAELQ